MTCPSELELSTYADGALSVDETRALERHLRSCAACRGAADGRARERIALMAALRQEVGQEERVPIPRLRRPAGPRELLAGGAVAAALSLCVGIAWLDIADVSLPAALGWLNPFDWAVLWTAAPDVISFILEKGSSIMTEAMTDAAACVAFAFVAWTGLALRRRRSGGALLLTLGLAAAAVPLPGHALEIRHSEHLLTIPADETVHDTLVAAAETVAIDGTVEGDVIAAARRVVVRGHVTGVLVTAAETIDIEGRVDGSLAGFGGTMDVTNAEVGRNLYAFARHVTVADGAAVTANATVFAETADLSGSVGTDLTAIGNDLEVSAKVARNFQAFGQTVTVLRPANIGGDVVAHVPAKDKLRVASDATVAGSVRTEIFKRSQAPSIEHVPFLARQAVRFAAAFVAGLLVLWLLPSLRTASLENGTDALITGGIGLLTLVCLPIVAIIIGVTIIGLPIALAGIALWLASLYFAKILLAHFIGRTVLAMRIVYPTIALSLVVGLILVLILVNVPFVGGLLNFVMTLVGLGMILEVIYRRLHGRRATAA